VHRKYLLSFWAPFPGEITSLQNVKQGEAGRNLTKIPKVGAIDLKSERPGTRMIPLVFGTV